MSTSERSAKSAESCHFLRYPDPSLEPIPVSSTALASIAYPISSVSYVPRSPVELDSKIVRTTFGAVPSNTCNTSALIPVNSSVENESSVRTRTPARNSKPEDA